MEKAFDPYHRWLGIPASQQPANYYRLLGLENFEADPEVIADAAHRQTAHVRSYQNGPQAKVSQKILNELATASSCLQDLKRKAQYDIELRKKLALPDAGKRSAPASPPTQPSNPEAELIELVRTRSVPVPPPPGSRLSRSAKDSPSQSVPPVVQRGSSVAREPLPQIVTERAANGFSQRPEVAGKPPTGRPKGPLNRLEWFLIGGSVVALGGIVLFLFLGGLASSPEKAGPQRTTSRNSGEFASDFPLPEIVGETTQDPPSSNIVPPAIPVPTSDPTTISAVPQPALPVPMPPQPAPPVATTTPVPQPMPQPPVPAPTNGRRDLIQGDAIELRLGSKHLAKAVAGEDCALFILRATNSERVAVRTGQASRDVILWAYEGSYPKNHSHRSDQDLNGNTGNEEVLFNTVAGQSYFFRVTPFGSTSRPEFTFEITVNSVPAQVITNSLGMKFAYCPPGEFMMGSPKSEAGRGNETQHKVILTEGFYLGVHEVTQSQYVKIMNKNPSVFASRQTANLPVENVTWDDAMEFCRRLSIGNGSSYRLPTEAEWEYACRAGTTTPFSFGTTCNGLEANVDASSPYGTNIKGQRLGHPTLVGSYSPNAWGLYDLHGNVAEWCSDWYGDYPTGTVTNPTGPSQGTLSRVNRGGGWDYDPRDCRSADRGRSTPGSRGNYLGFRVLQVQSR